MKKTNLTLLLASLAVGFSKSQKLNVYPLVDGLEQSPFYKVQVKQGKGIENNTKSLLDRGV